MAYESKASGFTLVELSIVLVVIGLIVGGVLVGLDLVDAARVRKQISQFEEIETQINTFKVKYNCLPGDCVDATSFLGSSYNGITIYNGNGDGVIKNNGAPVGDCVTPVLNNGMEPSQAITHLNSAFGNKYYLAGLALPDSVLGGGILISCLDNNLNTGWAWGYYPSAYRHIDLAITIGLGQFSQAGGYDGPQIIYLTSGRSASYKFGIPANLAEMIDTKIDDGISKSGNIFVTGNSQVAGCYYGGGATGVNPDTVSYQSLKAASNCNVSIAKIISTQTKVLRH